MPVLLYPVTMGATTTIWERWDFTLPTGDINPGKTRHGPAAIRWELLDRNLSLQAHNETETGRARALEVCDVAFAYRIDGTEPRLSRRGGEDGGG
jgi:hypothetical protein